jgi:hypothetical protein
MHRPSVSCLRRQSKRGLYIICTKYFKISNLNGISFDSLETILIIHTLSQGQPEAPASYSVL